MPPAEMLLMLRNMLHACADDDFREAADQTCHAMAEDEWPVVPGMAIGLDLADGSQNIGTYYVVTDAGLYFGVKRKRGLFSSASVSELVPREKMSRSRMVDEKQLEIIDDQGRSLVSIRFPGTLAPGRFLQFSPGYDPEYQTPQDQAVTVARALGFDADTA